MRIGSVVVVLCVAVAPALADPVTYTFNVTSGTLSMDTSPDGAVEPDPLTGALAGTFALTVYQSNGHIGESGTFILEDAALTNTELLDFSLMGLGRCSIYPDSTRFLDFAPSSPGHIGSSGTAVVDTDAYVEFTVLITGTLNTTLTTANWAGEPRPLDMTFTTSGTSSDVLTVGLAGTLFSYDIGVRAITTTITFDLIIDVVGTAHIVPSPALGGLSALGLAGAAAWLRRWR